MFKQLKNPLKFGSILLVSIILTLGFSLSLQSLLATWTAPNSTPPDSNIEDFLVGGGLGVAGNMSVGGNSTLALSSDRRVGIGTSTLKAKLDIFSTSTDDLFAVRDSVNDPTPFMIKQDGRVGIGTSNPSYKLDVNGKINGSELCIGGNCKNTWPGVYSAGTGLSLLNGVFSIDDSVVQKRVASNCSAWSSIRAINQNGTVVCETDDTGSSWPTGNYCIFKNG